MDVPQKKQTKKFIDAIIGFNPDVINLHNVHGYYLNIDILFDYIKQYRKPVVWTLHDCWSITGHCSYFDAVNCDRWISGCFDCPNKHGYPTSLLIDNSKKNYLRKKELYSDLPNLTLIAPCKWMANIAKQSFLKGATIKVIYNGVNTSQFKPSSEDRIERLRKKYDLIGRYVILGVASVWDKRKGLNDFITMSSLINDDEKIVLVGLNKNQLEQLPNNIIGVNRTESIEELVDFYSMANVFVNPTHVDNFPTTNIESLACGTPVVTYDTGGSPEAISKETGRVVAKGNISGVIDAVRELFQYNQESLTHNCRLRAEQNFNSNDKFKEYVNLFKEICITTI